MEGHDASTSLVALMLSHLSCIKTKDRWMSVHDLRRRIGGGGSGAKLSSRSILDAVFHTDEGVFQLLGDSCGTLWLRVAAKQTKGGVGGEDTAVRVAEGADATVLLPLRDAAVYAGDRVWCRIAPVVWDCILRRGAMCRMKSTSITFFTRPPSKKKECLLTIGLDLRGAMEQGVRFFTRCGGGGKVETSDDIPAHLLHVLTDDAPRAPPSSPVVEEDVAETVSREMADFVLD
jgi:hypothetical protein